MATEKFNIVELVNNNGCFDLQFRKDTRHERTGAPTYYRWKIQFIITEPKESIHILKKAQRHIGCGKITVAKNQARFSVQDIDDIASIIVPFFTKNRLSGQKDKAFGLWQKAVSIISLNKGKPIATWKRNDLMKLIEIRKLHTAYKHKPKQLKWIGAAQQMTRSLAA